MKSKLWIALVCDKFKFSINKKTYSSKIWGKLIDPNILIRTLYWVFTFQNNETYKNDVFFYSWAASDTLKNNQLVYDVILYDEVIFS